MSGAEKEQGACTGRRIPESPWDEAIGRQVQAGAESGLAPLLVQRPGRKCGNLERAQPKLKITTFWAGSDIGWTRA